MTIIYEIGIFLALGLVTGFLSGLLGIGGGFIRIPIFILLFPLIGINDAVLMHFAVGTSMALIIPTALAASIKQYKQGNLDLNYYWTWSFGIFIGVVIGLLLVPYCSAQTFKILFLILVLSVIVYLSFFSESKVISKTAPQGSLKVFIASLIGMVSALTGTAGGSVTMPVLKAFNVPLKKGVAMASATGLVVGLVGTAGFVYHGLDVPDRPDYSWGYISLMVLFAMLPTVFFGASLGARATNRCSERLIKRIFILLMLIIAANMLFKLVQGGLWS